MSKFSIQAREIGTPIQQRTQRNLIVSTLVGHGDELLENQQLSHVTDDFTHCDQNFSQLNTQRAGV